MEGYQVEIERERASDTRPFSIVTAVLYVQLYCRARPRQARQIFLWSVLPFALLAAMLQSYEVVPPTYDFLDARLRPTGWTLLLNGLFLASLLLVWTMWLRALIRDEIARGVPLRLGPDEGRVLASSFLCQFALSVMTFPVGLLAQIPGLGLLTLPFSIWVGVRLVSLPAYAIAERRIIVFEVWGVTQRVFWPALASIIANLAIIILAALALAGLLYLMGFDGVAAASSGAVPIPLRLIAVVIAAPVAAALFAFSTGPACYMVWRYQRSEQTAGREAGPSEPGPDQTAP
jgi:hypothetical protein